MKNLSKTSVFLYQTSLFNKPFFKKSNLKPKISFSCPLTQKGFHKKNFLNFIFFLFLLSRRKPLLKVAQDSNAFLKIRKGALVESFGEVQDMRQFFSNRTLFDFKKNVLKPMLNKNFFGAKSFSRKFKIKIGLTNSYNLYLLLGQDFYFYFIFNFDTKCSKHQKFLLSVY